MAMDFPSSPTLGQQYSVPGGPTYTWTGTAWRVLTPGNQFNRTTFTATAGQTVFSVAYTIGGVDVFRNGVKLVSGSDFTATDGATITLANAATVGDTVEVISYSQVVFSGAAKAEDVYSVVRGMKNRIINGAMVIDQRNAGASVTPTDGAFTVDRWQYWLGAASKLTAQQSTNAPSGFKNSLLTTSSSAYSIGATEHFSVLQPIEGLNVYDLGWGAAGAQNVTLSFWVRSSLTGTFGGWIRNSAGDRLYAYSYTINAANTWEYKTVTIAGDTSGTWLTTNGVGIYVAFSLGAGSSRVGAAGSWGSSPYYGVSGQQNLVSTNGATFYITGVQLEAGTVTNPVFERRPYGLELSLCQRYCQVFDSANGANVRMGVSGNYGGTNAFPTLYLPVSLRASPTVSYSSISHFKTEQLNGGQQTTTGIGLNSYNANFVTLTVTVGSSLSNPVNLLTDSTSAKLTLSAEL